MGSFSKEKAFVGPFSVIVKLKTSRIFVSSSSLYTGTGSQEGPGFEWAWQMDQLQ